MFYYCAIGATLGTANQMPGLVSCIAVNVTQILENIQ